jgi:hypothetical protein
VRELNGKASPEDVAFLKTHLLEWRTTLVGILERCQAHIVRLEAELADGVSHEQARRTKARLHKAKSFVYMLRKRLAELKVTMKQHNESERRERQRTPTHKKVAYAWMRGWGEGINYFMQRMENGESQEEALEASIQYVREAFARKIQEEEGEAEE